VLKVYRHPKYCYDLESVMRFIPVEYVTDIKQADYVDIATSEPAPVFEGITKPIVYSYIREHPYPHDEYLKTQFDSLQPTQDITIFSLGSFDYFAPTRKNIIIDQFELDAYHRLFVKEECEIQQTNLSKLRFLFLGGKANKGNRKPLLDMLVQNETFNSRLAWSMFGVDGGDELDTIQIEDNHYIGYPYDRMIFQLTNFSIIAETHFDGNQEFHPTEKTYRTIANMHPFAVLSTPFFMDNLRKRGYKTFYEFVNETYDMEKDPQQRLRKFTGSMFALNGENLDWHKFEDICKHNVNTLKKNALNTRKKIIKSLEK
tara:strand:+ start:867 stop:1811 length:945 start_codon:yes stop_codon:yes gene_type:complete